MKKFAILKNGVLEYAPVNYTLSDGRIITNFNKSETMMRKYGFKEVIDIQPEYDDITEYLLINSYTENEENIVINYVIKQMNTVDIDKNIEEKVIELKVTDTDHEIAIVELYEMIAVVQNKVKNEVKINA